jgi:ubiquitin-like protein Pup
MAERIHKNKQSTGDSSGSESAIPPQSEGSDKLRAELDELLDEIDEVLESNAEDFVKSYIQKGGE